MVILQFIVVNKKGPIDYCGLVQVSCAHMCTTDLWQFTKSINHEYHIWWFSNNIPPILTCTIQVKPNDDNKHVWFQYTICASITRLLVDWRISNNSINIQLSFIANWLKPFVSRLIVDADISMVRLSYMWIFNEMSNYASPLTTKQSLQMPHDFTMAAGLFFTALLRTNVCDIITLSIW